MSQAPGTSPSTTSESRKRGGFGGLIAILVSIVIGILVGVFYGGQMWLASGEVSEYRERLEKTLAQKDELAAQAEAAGDLQRAEELRSHKPIIEARILEVEELQESAEENRGSVSFQFAAIFAVLTEFVGDLFLQVLKLLVILLVVTSMICVIKSMGNIRKI